jgi:hypothetical protein
MKKGVIYFSVLLLAVFMITGCKKDKDNDNNNGQESKSYFYHEGHSYQIVKQSKTWVEAAADAVERGGYLVEIGSQAEQDAVYQGIKDSGIAPKYTTVNDGGGIGYIWIGATDRAGEGVWVWNGANKTSGYFPIFWIGDQTGGAVADSYVNWGGKSNGKFNEPDNFTHPDVSPNGQNAAAIGLASWPEGSSSPLGVAGEWNDIAENNKIYYIVEYDTIVE